jgi:hypothetical protein
MKRWALLIGILLCVGFQSSLVAAGSKGKETTADMSATKNIFIGWVDLHPDLWARYGYDSQANWVDAINRLNETFQANCRTEHLSGRTVTGAKDSKDENTAGQDLYVKFSDVNVDPKSYRVSVSIHFIDPKTNSEIASIPVRQYFGRKFSTFERYIRTALDTVGDKITVEITGAPPKK